MARKEKVNLAWAHIYMVWFIGVDKTKFESRIIPQKVRSNFEKIRVVSIM